MIKKEKAIFYWIVGICVMALIILAVVGLVLQSQPTATVSLPSSLGHSSSALESSRVSELAQPVSSASSQVQGGVEGITLSTYQISLTVGESQMPLVTMTPEDAPDQSEIWVSSDNNVATVNAMGRITGVGVGNCTVTVTSAANPAVSASVEVVVSAGAATAPSSPAPNPTPQPTTSVSTPPVTSEPEPAPAPTPDPTPEPVPEPTPEPSQPEESIPEESSPSTPEETVSQIVPGV